MCPGQQKNFLFSQNELVQATRGVLKAGKGTDSGVGNVQIDSRSCTKESLFIPLKGNRVDGHQFIEQALKNGVACFALERAGFEQRKQYYLALLNKYQAFMLLVDDTLVALQDLARFHIRRFPALIKIGITGSSGKTTTKEILGSILQRYAQHARHARIIITQGNYNSEIGVPLTVFRVLPQHRYAVFEMGINHIGEMDILSDIIRPDMAVITNISSAHIGLLHSIRAIMREKKKICQHFDGRQSLFINEDIDFFTLITKDIKGKVITFGKKSTEGYRGKKNLGLDGMSINWEGLQIQFPLFGNHNLSNALAAISVAKALGVESHIVKEGLEQVKPLFGRSQVIRGVKTIIKDCYNANPDSVNKLIDFLEELEFSGKKVLVLGSMMELGKDSKRLHAQIGERAAKSGMYMVVFFGQQAKAAFAACKNRGFSGIMHWTADFAELKKIIKQQVKDGDLVAIKASRAMQLERLVESLMQGQETSGVTNVQKQEILCF